MLPRIEGSTLPGLTVTCTDDTGTAISDGLSYTWTCQAALAVSRGVTPTQLFNKTTGITSTTTGFTVVWAAADIGTLTAVGGCDTSYTLEFTGTFGSNVMKHQELVKVRQQIP